MRTIVWDFDGTLAERPGQWSGTLASVLKKARPDSTLTAADFRPHMQQVFPWDTPEIACTPVKTPDEWWNCLLPGLERVFRLGAHLSDEDAKRLAAKIRDEYIDLAGWRLYDDTLPALRQLSSDGWSHVILSNHVPELEDIVEALGVTSHFKAVFNSARTGFEKPHPEAFRQISRALGNDTQFVMVGDRMAADIKGAQNVGWPAILVRRHDAEARICCESLSEIPEVLKQSTDS